MRKFLSAAAALIIMLSVCSCAGKKETETTASPKETAIATASSSSSEATTGEQSETTGGEEKKEVKSEETEKKSSGSSSQSAGGRSSSGKQQGSTKKSSTGWAYGDVLPEPSLADLNAQWNLLLVNRDYILPENYENRINLVRVLDDSEEYLDSRVAPYYRQMFNAAAEDGIYLTPISGYRSYDLQKENFEERIQSNIYSGYSRTEALKEASSVILPPGTSEHNAGLAMDIISLSDSFENSEAFAWLKENAADYGFILRYPKEKQNITKIVYEPWHWRYVGKDIAYQMNRNGQCLEEFLGKS